MAWRSNCGSISSRTGSTFTPDGHAIDLPKGATPLDFAYRVHTEVGYNCRGAKINGRIVPLNYSLQTGEQVEIITGKHSGPSRDWLNSNLGYVTTSRRGRRSSPVSLQARDQNVAAGKAPDRTRAVAPGAAAGGFRPAGGEGQRAYRRGYVRRLGAGDLRLAHLVNYAQQLVEPDRDSEQLELIPRKPSKIGHGKRGDVQIQGVGNLLTQMAGCRQPLPGDPIVGYITLGRGVTHPPPGLRHRAATGGTRTGADDPGQLGPEPVRTIRWISRSGAYDRSRACCATCPRCCSMSGSTFWR